MLQRIFIFYVFLQVGIFLPFFFNEDQCHIYLFTLYKLAFIQPTSRNLSFVQELNYGSLNRLLRAIYR